MQPILVSACLLGRPVRYDGRAKPLQAPLLARWQAEGRLIPICPEVAAGLLTPRPASEIAPGDDAAAVLDGHGAIRTRDGADVTAAFVDGAAQTVALARHHGCRHALLIDGSPSCGSGFVYSGRFDGLRQPGRGVVAEALIRAGVAVFAPAQIAQLAAALES
ncbi:Purine nucleoside phosphorylase [Roseibacterium elongatum DSM 19469]|uniref:Purine nucleoside phosphorylase n=1 Tax=Roseicyclus elongatus DSM 19469 TaxID=1294273 RepID=W8S1G2_9RHOB|nr:DUF523 domain-containing protein [Roseibacterium elongatum]AHM03992.1 Purine nucleoside phosphorylase [Roseibacterium elongatum DSM 19469]